MDYLRLLSECAPLLVGLLLYRHLSDELRLLVPLFAFALAVDTLSFIMINIPPPPEIAGCYSTLPLLHLVTPVEYCVFILVISSWQKNERWRTAMRLSVVLFFVAWVVFKITLESPTVFDYASTSLESILLIGAASKTLYEINKELPEAPLLRLPRFWVTASALFYFTGNILHFAGGLEQPILRVHDVINPIANLGYTGAFLCTIPRLNPTTQ